MRVRDSAAYNHELRHNSYFINDDDENDLIDKNNRVLEEKITWKVILCILSHSEQKRTRLFVMR